MAEFDTDLLLALQEPGGFDAYFPDIVYARDSVDPPVRRHRRSLPELSPKLEREEYEIRSSVDIDNGRFVLEFGSDGLREVAQAIYDISEAPDFDSEVDQGKLAIDGLRFAVVFQATQVFINTRLKNDKYFFSRFKNAFPPNRNFQVPYERMEVLYPEAASPNIWADTALQYRVCRAASRFALDRLCTTPVSPYLQKQRYVEGSIMRRVNEQYEREKEAATTIPKKDEAISRGLAVMTYMHLSNDDNHPLMWAALANPIPRATLTNVALAHIGEKEAVERPGWIRVNI